MSEEMNDEMTTGEVKQKKVMKIVGKVALGILVALVGLVGLFVVLLPQPVEYWIRANRGGVDQYDSYKIFAERPIAASPSPFYFKEEPAEAMVQALFEQNPVIDDLDDFLERNQTLAFIVIQNDAILYEKYFNGASRATIVTSYSVAKSWTSALIGAAIADGFIQSVDDPITDYLPELAERDPAFADITIHDLLRMSSGIKYEKTGGLDGDDAKTYYYHDLRQLAFEETIVIDPPGSYFLYNNYHPLLLGMILERTTGMSVAAYLEARIWQPIGMEFDGSWSLDSRDFEKMESGINARAIDFARFGQLYLNNGNWDGTQILPADWVAESTRPEPSRDSGAYYRDWPHFKYRDGYYGLMWMGTARGESDYDYFAEGHYGQEIYVSPHKNLIIVRNGKAYGEFGQAWPTIFYQFASDIEL